MKDGTYHLQKYILESIDIEDALYIIENINNLSNHPEVGDDFIRFVESINLVFGVAFNYELLNEDHMEEV